MNEITNRSNSQEQCLRELQLKILYIMKYVDNLCRKNGITYFIMGGTALGAVRHGGFIPWDDDLDIFMTPDQYEIFKRVFNEDGSKEFVIQEWRTVPEYLEYAKVRMNGTTYIEANLKARKDMHHGIYIDIMILHKVPNNPIIQRLVYLQSKFVTLYGLSQRNWKPKTRLQSMVLRSLKILPKKSLARWCYKSIYKYDRLLVDYQWSYFITPAKFNQGVFPFSFFSASKDILFEGIPLSASKEIEAYLSQRYGNYWKLPNEKQRKFAAHAYFYNVSEDYLTLINIINPSSEKSVNSN